MECKAAHNKQGCACASKNCERHGLCCDCLRFHLARKSLPMCMRKLDWIKTVS